MTLPEKMLLEALSAAARGETVDWTEPIPTEDWQAFFRMAHVHQVLPLVFEAVYTTPAAQAEPSVAGCKQSVIRQVMSQTVRTSDFLHLYGYLTGKGIRPLVVKGLVCRSMYPKGDYRTSGDEDILIPEEDWPAALDALREYGMAPTSEPDPTAHEIGFVKGQLYIEAHRTLFPSDSDAYGELCSLFTDAHSRAADYPVEPGISVRSLSPHDHLLYLILHAYKHFIHSGFGIRQVCDIGLWAMCYGSEIDWDLLRTQCASVRAAGFASAVLRLAEMCLAIRVALPSPWSEDDTCLDPMLHDLLSGGVYGATDMNRLHSSTVTVNAVAADRGNKRHSVLSSVFPSAKALEGRYPYLKRHPALLPVAWAGRLLKYGKETASSQGTNSASESIRIGKERADLLRLYGIIE